MKKLEDSIKRLYRFAMPKPRQFSRYADMYERGLAAVIDVTLIFLAFNWLFTRLTQALYASVDRTILAGIDPKQGLSATLDILVRSHMASQWLLNFALQLVIIGVIYVGVQIATGTTPGRWLLGLRIVRRADEGALSPIRYVLRYLAYIPSCLPLMAGVFLASFNRERRALHDYLSGTVVLRTRPEGWYWAKLKQGARWVRGKRN